MTVYYWIILLLEGFYTDQTPRIRLRAYKTNERRMASFFDRMDPRFVSRNAIVLQ